MIIIDKNTRFTIFSRYTKNQKIPVQSELLASFTSMNNISQVEKEVENYFNNDDEKKLS